MCDIYDHPYDLLRSQALNPSWLEKNPEHHRGAVAISEVALPKTGSTPSQAPPNGLPLSVSAGSPADLQDSRLIKKIPNFALRFIRSRAGQQMQMRTERTRSNCSQPMHHKEITYIRPEWRVVCRGNHDRLDQRWRSFSGAKIMTKISSSYWRSLALASVFLLSPSIAAAQAQGTGQASSQPPMSAGDMMEKHDAMSGMPGAPMQDGMKMPSEMPPMAKSRRSATHRRHAKPTTHRQHARPTPMPATDKPMPMQDDM